MSVIASAAIEKPNRFDQLKLLQQMDWESRRTLNAALFSNIFHFFLGLALCYLVQWSNFFKILFDVLVFAFR